MGLAATGMEAVLLLNLRVLLIVAESFHEEPQHLPVIFATVGVHLHYDRVLLVLAELPHRDVPESMPRMNKRLIGVRQKRGRHLCSTLCQSPSESNTSWMMLATEFIVKKVLEPVFQLNPSTPRELPRHAEDQGLIIAT